MLVLNDPEITSLSFKLKVAPARSRNVVIQYFAHEKIPSLLTVQGATTAKTEEKKAYSKLDQNSLLEILR